MGAPNPDAEIFRSISRVVERLSARLHIAEKRIAVLELESAQRRLLRVDVPGGPPTSPRVSRKKAPASA